MRGFKEFSMEYLLMTVSVVMYTQWYHSQINICDAIKQNESIELYICYDLWDTLYICLYIQEEGYPMIDAVFPHAMHVCF